MRTNLKDAFNACPAAGTIDGRARIVDRNTFRYRTTDGRTVTRLHFTDVCERLTGDRYRLNSGGWQTRTTRDRINSALADSPYSVWSDRGIWYCYGPDSARVPFYDGIELPSAFTDKRGIAERAGRDVRKLGKLIDTFVRETLPDGCAIPTPSNGDCWFCTAIDAEPPASRGSRESIGHMKRNPAPRDSSHLREHVREKYMHGSLILNALRYAGFNDTGVALIAFGDRPDYARIRRTVKRYLRIRLGLAV